MSCLVIKDQISHLVHSFAQASLTASSCVNFLLNEQAGAGCRQQEHADWQPQRRSHAFDCFRFLFIFLRPVDLIRKLSKEAFHLMNGQNLSFFHSKLLFFALSHNSFLSAFYGSAMISFVFPRKISSESTVATATEVGGQLKLERRGIFQRWIGGLTIGGLTGAMRAASGQSATPG